TAFATYIPGRVQTSEYLARATGIPQDVLEQKFGIKQKPWAAEGEQVSEMAVKAARAVLRGHTPGDLDAVLWTGSEYKDFPVWSAGVKVQHEIGAVNAWSADVAARCATTQVCLKFAKDMITADEDVRQVLLAGGHRMIDKLNYQNPRARFLINMSDAASAILVEKDGPRNEILHTSLI